MSNKDDLFAAVEKNNQAELSQLLKKLPEFTSLTDKSYRDEFGRTLLHLAAFKGHNRLIKPLIEAGIDVDIYDPEQGKGTFQKTPLHVAAEQGHEIAVRTLIKHGADPNIADATGQTALHYATKKGHMVVSIFLINHEKTKVDIHDRDESYTPMHLAAGTDNEEVLRALLEKKADPNARDSYGRNSLHRALRGRKQRASALLIDWDQDNKVDINAKDGEGKTAMHHAARQGMFQVLRSLKDHGADENITDNKGRKPSELATDARCKKFFMDLLGDIDDISEEVDSEERKKGLGMRMIHETVKGGDAEAVNEVLAKNPDLETLDTHYRTALHLAAKKGHADIIPLLLERGANPNPKDEDDKRPLHHAVIKGHPNCVVELCKSPRIRVNAKDESGYTPLMTALMFIDEIEDEAEAIVKTLLEKGANVHAADNEGKTCYQYAEQYSDNMPQEVLDLFEQYKDALIEEDISSDDVAELVSELSSALPNEHEEGVDPLAEPSADDVFAMIDLAVDRHAESQDDAEEDLPLQRPPVKPKPDPEELRDSKPSMEIFESVSEDAEPYNVPSYGSPDVSRHKPPSPAQPPKETTLPAEQSSSSEEPEPPTFNKREVPEMYNEFFAFLDGKLGRFKVDDEKEKARVDVLQRARGEFQDIVTTKPDNDLEHVIVHQLTAKVTEWKNSDEVQYWDLYSIFYTLLMLALALPTLGASIWVPLVKDGNLNFWTENRSQHTLRKLEEDHIPSVDLTAG